MFRSLVAIAFVALLFPLSAQEQLSETIEVRVVNVDAVVTDRDGKPVKGLTAADFEILENGARQTITNFLEIRGEEALGGPHAATPQPRRFVFFVDGQSIHPYNRKLLAEALRKFVDTGLEPTDLASVVSWNNTLSVLAPLTADRKVLNSAIDKVATSGGAAAIRTDLAKVQRACKQSVDRALSGSIPFGHAYEECIISAKEETMLTAQRSRRVLNAIELSMTTIAGIEGKKFFVLAGATLPKSPGVEAYQWANQLFIPYMRGFDGPTRRPDQDDEQTDFLERAARTANAHGVTLYAIAATTSADTAGIDYQHAVDDFGADYANQANTFDSFETLSEMTGGFSINRPTDYSIALTSIAGDSESYYSLGYRPRDHTGGDRNVEVRLRNRALNVRARRTHALKTADELMTDRVVSNIFLEAASTEWKPRVATGDVVKEGKTFKVPFEVTIPASLTLLPSGDGTLSGRYTVYIAVGTAQGALSTVFRQPETIQIAAAQEKAFRKQPLTFGAMLSVRPGENILSVGVVDEVGGERAFTRTTIVAK